MKHDMSRRFAYIETQLFWGDGVTAAELGKVFGLARQNAQAVIKLYYQYHPDNMEYNAIRRRQVATERFSPHHIRPDPHRFLEYQRGVAMVSHYHAEEDWMDFPILDTNKYLKPRFRVDALRKVLAALRRREAVNIMYHAKAGERLRDISPHHLVFADGRYHLRAYCHAQRTYLDFVLTRIMGAASSATEWVSAQGDQAWHRHVTLTFQLNPELPSEVSASLAADYSLTTTRMLVINGVKDAVSIYLIRHMIRPDWQIKIPLWISLKSGNDGNVEG